MSRLEKESTMSKVVALMSMSLDGFVADPDDGVDEIFAWYFAGDVEVATADPGFTFRVSAASAEHLRALQGEIGAMLTGRRTFEKAGGWGGQHPWGIPAFVIASEVPPGWPKPASPVYFATEGIELAVERAREAAGGKSVGVHGGKTISTLLNAGLLDEICVDLVAVLLGSGVSLFEELENTPIMLGDPTVVVGAGVTHLRYPVIR
jgi:dihydrofolate reductase